MSSSTTGANSLWKKRFEQALQLVAAPRPAVEDYESAAASMELVPHLLEVSRTLFDIGHPRYAVGVAADCARVPQQPEALHLAIENHLLVRFEAT